MIRDGFGWHALGSQYAPQIVDENTLKQAAVYKQDIERLKKKKKKVVDEVAPFEPQDRAKQSIQDVDDFHD